ncbi:DNA-binding transcriptional regulator, MarR family [Agreia bicolorata]|uniref:DNA-binding transcriptional regulator, MarR family n=1 Tax=Agreia bicolorata TaxID=110935 RepID=A0A1T4YGF8_9MICO|nr:MarR family transcriptional regulator [Agreia bicolorata]KJC63770.1 MarR family transcriptional regulator [Agreia bicolorata]SKB00907.1 DNA-binding transcriptional regulator, MarR family [Agreia bicolorata]
MTPPLSLPALSSELRGVTMHLSRRLRNERADIELSDSQFSVLAYLVRTGAHTPNELSVWEHVTPPSMNRTINALEAAGLVARTPDASDGRKVFVTATENGCAVVKETRRRRDAWLHSRLSALTPDERRTLEEATVILRKLVAP